ncbi:MAG TPA: hypothetical protein DEO70_12055 [Bacteroidales bacterium]|nr:MAG: hypothetical protein A2X11_10045 [Bacteroidetes bacterium GWE2_42_24]OFY25853.1 MAG: hypothetical protein A2X09_09420 [Bacteroidetes bacterium GWF2_43_11]HBZ67561.1 hypothetical protein [Bacteroidales bacterium]
MNNGRESLQEAVKRDCSNGQDCFNENGCNHEFYKNLPEDNPEIRRMGFETKCVHVSKCSHKYCDKYKWILDRAEHYSVKTGKTTDQILDVWEKDRTYWYMNYYQECNQPVLEGENIIFYDDWISALKARFGDDPKLWAFKCPACGNIQTIQDFLDHNIETPEKKVYFNCIGRYINGIGCNWSLGGLLKIHTCTVIKDAQPFPVFKMATIDESEERNKALTINL